MLTFMVPPGIGDFSAMYSKLCYHTDREIEIRPSAESPHRLLPFLELLPNIRAFGYGYYTSLLVLAQSLPPCIDINELKDGEYFFSINSWLENGGSVDNWLPGPTNYHYPMIIPEGQIEIAQFAIKSLRGLGDEPIVGVYSTSYSNSRHWGFWGPVEWLRFLKLIREMIDCRFVFIGAEYDLAVSEVVHHEMMRLNESMNKEYFKAHYLVGQHEIGTTIELIRSLDYFFSFPSGLGFLADVVNTPHTMWFPRNLDLMRYTFSDPKNNGSRTLHELFDTPEELASQFKTKALSFLEEICRK